jgi:predicted porin
MTNIMWRGVVKRLVAVAFSLAVLFEAGEVHAQTSVTLYGVVDTGVGYVKTALSTCRD